MGQSGQKQTTTTEIDPDIKSRQLGLYGDVQDFISGGGLQAYGGPRVAGFSPLQEQAFGLAGQFANDPSMSGVAQAQQASGVAGDIAAGGGLMGGIRQFQNPYEDQVVQQTLSDIDQARRMQEQDIAGQATRAGAFGGTRQAVMESELNRSALEESGRRAAQLRRQGFTTAADLASQDIGQRLQGAGMLSQFGGDIGRRGASTIGLLGQFGGQQQAQQQAQLTADQQRFMEQQGIPLREFGLRQQVLTGFPVGQSQTTSMPGNRGAGFAGGALTGASIGSAFGPWGAGIGAVGGGLLGLF